MIYGNTTEFTTNTNICIFVYKKIIKKNTMVCGYPFDSI